MIRLLFAALMWLALGIGALAQGVQGVATSGGSPAPEAAQPSANDLHEFTRLLGDTRIQDWIKSQATAAQAEGTLATEGGSLRDVVETTVARTKARIAALSKAVPNLRR